MSLEYSFFLFRKKIIEVVAYAYNSSTREAETERSPGVQGQPGVHSEFKASLNHKARPSQKIKQNKTKQKEDGSFCFILENER